MAKISQSQHVAVLAFPFGSHAAPLLSLIRNLAAASPTTKFSFFGTSRSNQAIFLSSNDDNIKPYDVVDGLPEGFVPSGNPIEAMELFLEATPENFKSALEVAEEESGLKIGCLVSDAFFWFAGEIADEKQVPWVPLWTAAPRSLLCHLDTDLIRRSLGSDGSGDEDQTLDFLPGFSEIRKADIPKEVFLSGKSESPFESMMHKMALMLPKAKAVSINSFHEVDPEIANHLKTRFRSFLNVGPFTLTSQPNPKQKLDEHGCLEWLDKQEPGSVVYISFGSVVTPPPHEVAALVDALEESGFPFLWSFRGNQEGLLKSCLSGKLVPWAPQVEVLKHASVGAFVTHCGWNSVLETIIGGVPLIGRSFFGDQKLNLRTCEAVWGIGVGIEGGVITKEGMIKALQRVLLEERNVMREKIRVLKKLAHEAVESNGGSTQDFNTLVEIVTKSN
ncbi:hypothetical protein UlMin_004285 [Ulmus minor]